MTKQGRDSRIDNSMESVKSAGGTSIISGSSISSTSSTRSTSVGSRGGIRHKVVGLAVGIYCMLLALVAGLIVVSMRGTATPRVGLETQISESVEHKRGVASDYWFEIVSDTEIDSDNLLRYVIVSDMSGQVQAVSVVRGQSNNAGVYRVQAPKDGYKAGHSYSIDLEGVRFAEEVLANNSSLMFTVGKPEVERAVLRDGILMVDSENVVDIMDDRIVLRSDEYSIGDILGVVNDREHLARKVVGKAYNKGSVVYFVELPSIDETFAELDIYKEYHPESGDVQVYIEEEISRAVLETKTVGDIGRIVDEYRSEIDPYYESVDSLAREAASSEYIKTDEQRESAERAINDKRKPDSIKLGIDIVKLSPLLINANFEITWKLGNPKHYKELQSSRYNQHYDIQCQF